MKTSRFIISTLCCFLLICTGCGNRKDENRKYSFNKIQGWNILSDNSFFALQTIKTAKEYDINHLQLSHHLVHDLRDIRDPHKRDVCNQLIETAHQHGIGEVVVWDHAFYDLDYYPKQFRTGPEGTIDMDNPNFWEWFATDYREMLDMLPDVDGIVLTFIETGAHAEFQHSLNLISPSQKLAKVLNEVARIVVEERKLKLYARTFIYTREELANMLECVELIENDEVILMVKEVPHDFFLTHPVQSYIDRLKRPVLIEFDAAHEYSGQGIIANTFVETFSERWKFYQSKPNVIGYVARTDRYHTSSIINRPSEILLYTLYRLNQNPSISDEDIYREFIEREYGVEVVDSLLPVFKSAYDIITSSLYTLGLCMADHSALTCHYQSVYNRYVSGRWMQNPLWYVGHEVEKEFHYYTEVVNTLSPAHLKEKGSRLFKEDPFLLNTDWITPKELMNKEYLEYIITEKDYGVKLSREAVRKIQSVESSVSKEKYQDLYDTFYRTYIKSRLSRGAAKAYFSYRILINQEIENDQELLDIFWEGIDEMYKMAKIATTEITNSPVGEWNWDKDLSMVNNYIEWMTETGWKDYQGAVIKKRKL